MDYRDKVIVFDPRPMPRIDDILNNFKISRYKLIDMLDLTKGYRQVPLDDDTEQKSAFVPPFGHFSFNVMPFGMVNAPQTLWDWWVKYSVVMKTMLRFSLMILVFTVSLWRITLYIWLQLLQLCKRLIGRLNRQSVSWVSFLQHIVGDGKIKPMLPKVQATQYFKVSLTKKHARSFLGLSDVTESSFLTFLVLPYHSMIWQKELTKQDEMTKWYWYCIQWTER